MKIHAQQEQGEQATSTLLNLTLTKPKKPILPKQDRETQHEKNQRIKEEVLKEVFE